MTSQSDKINLGNLWHVLRPECKHEFPKNMELFCDNPGYVTIVSELVCAIGGFFEQEGEIVGWSMTTEFADRFPKGTFNGYVEGLWHAFTKEFPDTHEIVAYTYDDFAQAVHLQEALGFEFRPKPGETGLYVNDQGRIFRRWAIDREVILGS